MPHAGERNEQTGGNPTNTLGHRIVEAREQSGLSTAQLARRLGVATRTLRNWETDHTEPRSNRLVMLSGLLGANPIWLLRGAGDPPNHEPEIAPIRLAELHDRLIELQDQLGQISTEIGDLVAHLHKQEMKRGR